LDGKEDDMGTPRYGPGLLASALLLTALPAAARAQQPAAEPPRTLAVSAMGTIERDPEQGVVAFAVETQAATAQAAAETNAQRMARLNAALRGAGVAERHIRTISYELRPEYARVEPGRDPAREPPRIVGYRAMNMVQVTVDDVTRVGALIDVAIGSGANRVTSIGFQLRDPHAAHLEAVAQAMQNARREAEAVAQAAGERLGPPISISTGGFAGPPRPPMPYARADAMEMAMVTPVEPGTLSVTAHVNVVYRMIGQ
jgi:uncharacterized protein